MIHFLHLVFRIAQPLGLSSILLFASFQSPLLVSLFFSSSYWNAPWLSSWWSSQSTHTPSWFHLFAWLSIPFLPPLTLCIPPPWSLSSTPNTYMQLLIWHHHLLDLCQLPCPKLNLSFFTPIYSTFPSQVMSVLPVCVFRPKILVSFIIPLPLWHTTSSVSSIPVGTIFTHIQNLSTSRHF